MRGKNFFQHLEIVGKLFFAFYIAKCKKSYLSTISKCEKRLFFPHLQNGVKQLFLFAFCSVKCKKKIQHLQNGVTKGFFFAFYIIKCKKKAISTISKCEKKAFFQPVQRFFCFFPLLWNPEIFLEKLFFLSFLHFENAFFFQAHFPRAFVSLFGSIFSLSRNPCPKQPSPYIILRCFSHFQKDRRVSAHINHIPEILNDLTDKLSRSSDPLQLGFSHQARSPP